MGLPVAKLINQRLFVLVKINEKFRTVILIILKHIDSFVYLSSKLEHIFKLIEEIKEI